MNIEQILQRAYPIIPVLSISRVEDAVPLAEALKAGGLTTLEVTLRTDAALDAIAAIKTVPDLLVGAGTVTTLEQMQTLQAIGADFAVSPGATPKLFAAATAVSIPFLPAVASVSEMMQGIEMGYHYFKFFPAEASGGVAALKSFSAPFPDIRFCPTGGISQDNFSAYLALANVMCVGGSWIVPADALNQQDWARIETLAREVCQHGESF